MPQRRGNIGDSPFSSNKFSSAHCILMHHAFITVLTYGALSSNIYLWFNAYVNNSLFIAEPKLEGASQETGLEKTGGERGDGPDVKGKIPPNLMPAKNLEAGKLPLKKVIHGVVLFYTIILS